MMKRMPWLALLALGTPPLAAQEAAAVTKYGRTSAAIGGGFLLSAYEVARFTDRGVKSAYTTHQITIFSGVAEIRHEVARGWDAGFRFIRSTGFDRSSKLQRVNLPGFSPPGRGSAQDTARKDNMDGMSFLLSLDTRWAGVTGGVATGRWVYASDFPMDTVPGERTVPMGAIRLGRFNGWHAEAGYGRHWPALAPRPVAQAGIARGNIDGTRLLRFGLGKEGLYVGGRYVTEYGLDIEPHFSARNASERQFGIVLKERFRLRK